MGLDFVLVSGSYKYSFIEHCTYLSYFLWIVGNCIWATGALDFV